MNDGDGVKIRQMGSAPGCFGWIPLDRESGRARTLVKVVTVNDPRGWGPEVTLTVRNREGETRTVPVADFEQRVRYSFDDGATWLTEKHHQVRKHLVCEYNRAEAALDHQTEAVAALRWKLERNGLDPDRRRRDIAAMEATLRRPCGYHKPGHGQRQWKDDQLRASVELKKLRDGRTPKRYHDDDDEPLPY